MAQAYERLVKKIMPAGDGKPACLHLAAMKLTKPKTLEDDHVLVMKLAKPKVLEDDHVLVRLGASPVNPSDLGGLLLGGDRLDESTVRTADEQGRPVFEMPLPEGMRVGDEESPYEGVGSEGAGVVEATGRGAESLLGKTVFVQGTTYSQCGVYHMYAVQVQPADVTAKQAASSFVNPMTVLGMLEKMRTEGHSALVHTAACSQLGRMLLRVCLQEGVDLVNVVRRPDQVEELKALGAKYIVNSSAETFREDLVGALAWSGATLAFDALGGGNLASMILECMEEAAWWRGDTGSIYGTTVWKQVYIYGNLERSPLVMSNNYGGYRWNLGGYMVGDFLESVSEEWRANARARIAAEISTTFRTDYCKEVSLRELLTLGNLKLAHSKSTNNKILIVP